MAENPPKVINVPGAVPGIPNIPDFSGPGPNGNAPALDFYDGFKNALSKTPEGGLASIPLWSFYHGNRYKDSRPFTDFEEAAGTQQSGWDQLANGVLKFAGIGGLQIIGGTAGIINGIGKMMTEGGKFSSLWDNPTNKLVDEATLSLEDALPNYMTRAQTDADWYSPEYLVSPNFIANDVIKNLGYAVGMVYGGKFWTNILKGFNIGNRLVAAGRGLETATAMEQAISQAPKLSRFGAVSETLNGLAQKYLRQPLANVMTQGDRVVGSVTGMFAEAGIESLQATNEYRKNEIEKYIQQFGERPTGEALDEINRKSETVGNYVWGLNAALLTASNYIQLPKILSSSRSAEKNVINGIEKQAGEALGDFVKSPSFLEKMAGRAGRLTDKTFGRLLKYSFSPTEAIEEGSQFAIQAGVKDYFSRSYKNPEEATTFFKSILKAIKVGNQAVEDTLTTNEGMKNLLIGGLSGGIMTAPGTYFESRMRDAGTNAALESLNKTKAPQVLKDMASYAIRGMESQKRRQGAIIDNDILTEKDEEANFLFSYLMPRVKYGKVDSVKDELDYYRKQASTDAGFNELVASGIINPGESKENFFYRLDEIQNRAEVLDKTYAALYDKYGNVYDKDKKRVYSDEVIDKMAYASAKIVDYDERLADLQLKLEGNGVEAYSLKEALYQSGSWQEGKINALGREEGVTKAIAKIIEDIETKDVVKDKKQDLKNDFNDYLEMSLRRKTMMEDYNAMLDKPEMFTENYISQKFDLDVSGEPIEITNEMSVIPGEKYIVGNNVEFDEEGNKKERAKELTIVQETTDGKIAVANEKGIIEMLTREEFQDYMVQKADDNLSVTGKFFRDFNGHRFQFNFGPKSGTREGRLIYNPVTDKITFVTDDGYTPLRRTIDGSFLISKEQGGKGRMTVVRTGGETAEQMFSYDEFTSLGGMLEETLKNDLTNTKDERADIINELYNSSKESLESIKKQVQEKRDRLLDIGRKIKEIRGQERTSFSKMLAASTSGLTALYNLAKQIKKDLESLKSQQAKVEFNLEYFQQMKEDLSTLPEQPEALVKELESQLRWVDKIESGFKSEVAHYESLADRVKKTIEQLAEFLRNAIQRFDSKYPTYIRDSFDRMIDNGDLLSEIPVVKEYLADYALLEDTKKDIAVNKPYAQELEKRLKAAADELGEINKERTALNDVLNEFKQVVARHKAAKEAEEKLRQDAEFQKQMDDQQTKTQAASGLIVDSPATPEGLEEEQTTSDEKDARKYINVVYSATVNSSKRARKPSVIRHDQFMEKVDFLPTKVRSKLRRIFVTANNEKALGLEGVINAYQEGYVPPEGEETVLAVYVKMEGTGYSFIDVDGNSVAKPTDENIDLSKLVFTTMPAPNESLPGYGFRYNEKATAAEVKAYLGAYVRWRERLFGMKDRTYPPEEFFVSRGILYKSKNKNHIVGNLMTQKQFEDGLPVIVVATADAIIHQNIEVTAKRGRVYIQNGGILQQVNTRNLTKEEVETVFEVLKEFVRKATVDKVWDPKLTQFLQGILYFQSPYQKIGEEVTKKEVSANQMYFRSGSFYMGKEEVPIPFSVSGLIDNEALVKDFLSKAYHHVNNSFAKNNTPFTSYTLDENKNLQPKTWTYQAYMLSPEGRTPEQAPLHTNARPVSSDVANDAKFEPGSRYTYSFNMLEVSAEDLAELVPTEQNPDKEAQTRTESATSFNEVAIEEDSPMAQALAAVRRAAQAAEQQKGAPVQPTAATFTPTPTPEVPTPESQTGSANFVNPAVRAEQNEKIGDNAKIEVAEQFNPKETKKAPSLEELRKQTPETLEDLNKKKFRIMPTIPSFMYALADVRAEKKYIEERTPFKVETIESLIQAGNGIYAFGSYLNGLIELSDRMEIGTGYHEMFEGIFDVFLSPKEKRKLFNEFARREGTFVDRETGKTIKYKDATAHQAIEEMAEEFRRFKLYNQSPPKAKTSLIRQFFETLMNWINSIFNGDIKNLTDLFSKMDAGLYSSVPFRDAPSMARRFREKIGTLTVQQAQVVVDNVVSRVFQNITYQGRTDILNKLDFSDFSASEVYAQVYKDLQNHFLYTLPNMLKEQGVPTEEYENMILPVWMSISSNWGLTKQYGTEMLKTFNIIQKNTDEDGVQQESDLEGEETDYAGGKSEDSYLQDAYMYDARQNAPASIKIAIATIQESVWVSAENAAFKAGLLNINERSLTNVLDPSTGLEVLVNFTKMFNRLMIKLHSVNTLKEKEAIVEEMANANPNFYKLYNRLKMGQTTGLTGDDWALKVKAYTTFAKQQTEGLIIYMQPDGTSTIGASDLHDSVKRSINEWFTRFQKNENLVKYSSEKKRFEFIGRSLVRATNNIPSQFKFLADLGINFSPVQMANVTAKQQEKLLKAINNIKSVIRNRYSLDATSLKTLDLTGNLRPIFEVYLESQNLEPESTYKNMDGQMAPSYLQTNTFSRVINDMNSAQTKQQLMENVSILSNPYSLDSVIINRMFDVEGDKVGAETSGVEEFRQGLFVEGTIDEYGDGVTTETMLEPQRLMQAIVMNLSGYYYMLIPAEGKREHMLNIPNLYENLESALPQMWSYYQTEVRLGGTEGRFFNFLANDLTQEQFNREFTKFVDNEVTAQFNQLSDVNIIEENVQKEEGAPSTYTWKGLPKNFLARGYKGDQLSMEQLAEILTFRTVNFFANNVEIQKMFFGDPQAIDDPTKRIKSFGSPTEQAVYDVPEWDAELNAMYNTVAGVSLRPGDPGYHIHKNSLTTVTVEDNITENQYLQSIREELKMGENYGETNSTDAQGKAPLSGFKHMQLKNGNRWNDNAETQYQFEMARDRIYMEMDGLFSYEGRESLKKHDQALLDKGDPALATFVPLKPKVSGYYGEKAILDKYSIAPITYYGVRGKNLASQYIRMLKQGVDYTIFRSGRKIGATDGDAYYTSDGDPNTQPYKDTAMIEVPFKWFGIQVETQSSKTTSTLGSQLSKAATINILDAGVPRDVEMSYDEWAPLSEEEKLAKSDLYKKYNAEKEARQALSDWGYDHVMDRLGLKEDGTVDAEKVLELIKDQLTRRQLNDNIRAALKIDPETKTFRLPLETLNNYEEIKSVLFAYIDKSISSSKVNGGSRVQVSGSGFEAAGKRIVAKKIKNKKGKEVTVWVSSGLAFYTKEKPYCEVLIPFIYGKRLRDAGIDITSEEVLRNLMTTEEGQKILRGVGFRIPTQELNSVEVFVIAGFLPESYGNMIVVPEDLTTKSGGDFDVDKLQTYLKNIYIDGNGEIRLVPFFGYGAEAKRKIEEMWDKGEFLKPAERRELDRIIDEERIALEDEDVYLKLFLNVKGISNLFSEEQITKEFMSIKDKGDFKKYAIEALYKQSIENQYFQAVEDLLTLEINFERLVAPNSAKELKDVRDTLVKISEEEFGDGAVKSLGSPTYMNRQRHAYLLSKGGVGIPASNQTNHAMVQKVPVIIDPSAIQDLDDDNERKYIQDASFKLPTDRITLKGKTYATLSRVFDRAGRYISAKISQYIDGFVDVIKDPFLVQIGVNRGNAGTFLFLERMQVPTNVVIMFMNQPIIREFNKILARNSTTYPYREDFIAEAKAYFPTSRTITSYRNAEDYNALAKELEGNIQKYYGDKQTKFSDEEAAYQQFILDEYLKYAVMSSNLLRFSQALNYDTTSFTNRHVLDKKLRDTSNASVNNIFKSADDVLKATYMGRVKENLEQAFTRVSKSLFKFLADDVKENISPIISEIMDRRGMKMRDKLLLVRRVEQSFISYLIHETNSLQSFANSLLINEDTALINTEYQNIMAEVSKSVFSPLAKNVVLTTMGSEDIKEPIDTKIVRLYERSRDARSQNQYIAAMEELRDNLITAEFYKKLVRLAFIQSGIRTSPISFTDIIPVEDFSPYVMAALKGLNNQGLLQDFIKSDTFYRNNWSNKKLVPRLRGKKVRDFSKTKEGAELNKFAEATGMQVKAFMVYTASREWNSSHIAVEDGRGDQKTTILLKKLESDGQPVLFKKTFKNGKTLTYGLYVSENAWGDAEKAEEHYRNPRKSEFNNRTFKMEREFSTAELLFILKGEWNKVAPENPSLVPMEEQQATVGEMDPNIEQPTVLGTETIPYTPSQSPDEFTFKDGTTVATPFNLNPEQREALFKLEEFYKNPSKMNNQITLQGYAGTGKTSVIAIFDKYLKSKYVRPYYTAPTHRANAVTKLNNPSARVLTLHALFGLAPNFEIENGDYSVEDLEYAEKNQPKIESGDLLIVDEASMVNKALNEYLRRAKADDKISIIYVGDPGQLKPPKDPDVSPVFTEGEQIYLTKVERTGDNAILEESTNLRNGKDFVYQTKVKDNIGVEYISGDAQARKVVAENFNSEEFKRNKLYFRVLAAKNREVQSMNRLVRDTLYDTTAQLVNGEILMGYSNWAVDYATKEPKIINGGDYQVTTFTEGTKTVSIGTERVQFNGYDAVVKNLLNPNAKAERVFIVDNNESDLKIDKFVNKISSLRKEAARIITIDRSKAAKMFQEARDLENMLAFMKDLKDDSGRYKVRKTFDYGYAHTIHKSQGGTYTKVLVLANTIDGAFDPETQQQLKYVAMSRATDFVYVSGRANPNPTARQAAAAQTRPAVIQRVSAPAPAAQATAGMSPFEAAMAAAARTRGQATPTEQPTPPSPAPAQPAKKTDTGQQIDIEPGYGLTKENFETTAEEAVKEAVPTPTDNRTDQEIMDSPEFKKYIEDMPFWVEMSYALETFKKCKL